jgi:hypothetical protein
VPGDAAADFAAICAELGAEPDVGHGTGFGSNPGLRFGKSIFAMLVRGELVVKLPAERCAALAESGGAHPFVIGKRAMREWVAVAPDGGHDWPALAREALAFARA